MLSILIPVYNFDIRELVYSLHNQCIKCNIVYEILCYDDSSHTEFKTINKEIGKLENVKIVELPQNLGRAKIRNKLGEEAKYDYLLFMDNDSKVTSEKYICNYVNNIKRGTVLYGGRVYNSTPPSEKQFLLHWKYGISREQQPVKIRKISPYHSFMTNNFLIPKEIFLQILFDKSIKGWGHEDTIFGLELKDRNIPIIHINNPLEHLGLIPVQDFLEKTHSGVNNLLILAKTGRNIDTKLLRLYKFVSKYRLSGILKILLSIFSKPINKNLIGDNPNLLFYDLWRLFLMLKNK